MDREIFKRAKTGCRTRARDMKYSYNYFSSNIVYINYSCAWITDGRSMSTTKLRMERTSKPVNAKKIYQLDISIKEN